MPQILIDRDPGPCERCGGGLNNPSSPMTKNMDINQTNDLYFIVLMKKHF